MLLSFRFWFFKGVAGHFPRNVLKQLQQLMGIDTTVAVGKFFAVLPPCDLDITVGCVHKARFRRAVGGQLRFAQEISQFFPAF